MLSAASAIASKSTWAVRSTSPGDVQRIDEGVPADRLQGLAGRALDVAVVDDQRRAALAHHALADAEREIVGAPFVDRADRRVAHGRGHELVEQRDHLVGNAEHEIVVAVDLDHALVPAVELLDRLVDRQRVEEFVGEDDRRAVRHLLERLVPHRRHVDGAERLLLLLAQLRIDLDQMQPRSPRGTPAPPAPRAARRASWCRGRGRARPAARSPAGPSWCHAEAAHSPISSPNTWLISGEVMKSPPRRADRASCSSRDRDG